jgi:ornithine cyclodeaminase/alanine dehydrogenase-like protein (mu-crystallin family)
MPLILTQDDLLPLVTDFEAMEGAFEAIEEAYREFHQTGGRTIDTIGLPVTGPQRAVRVCPGVAGSGISLRTYPVQGRDEFPDSSVNVLIDAESGRLLAVMAGEDINLFRTAVGWLRAASRRAIPSGLRSSAVAARRAASFQR